MRLFVGIPISSGIKEILSVSRNLQELGASVVCQDNLHITLKYLGTTLEDKIQGIIDKLKDISRLEPFRITLSEVGVFPHLEHINVIWIGINEQALTKLILKTHEALDYIRREDHQEIKPHLTIARVKSKNLLELQNFIEKIKGTDFGSMIVDRIVLYESTLTPEGSVYRPIQEFRFSDSITFK